MSKHLNMFTRCVVFLYVLSVGVTWVAGDVGKGVLGRFIAADFLGIVLIGLFVTRLAVVQPHFWLPPEFRAYLPLLLVFFFGVGLSRFPESGGFELIVHCFAFLNAVALYNLMLQDSTDHTPNVLLSFILWAGGILAGIGLADFLVWPGLLPGDDQSGLSGTFRNTGQAGAFYGVYLAILVPAVLSGMLPLRPRNVAIILILLAALIFTSKRAALIGFGCGLVLLCFSLIASPSKKDKQLGAGMLAAVVFAAPLIYLSFLWGLENVEGMAWRFGRKFHSGAIEDFQSGFLKDNISVTFSALFDNPLLGVGLGNIVGTYSDEYEIHSTYLAVLGTSGILGIFAYFVFIVVFARRIFYSTGLSREGLYLRYFLPMLIGLMVSWSYTYHLRKREFWVMFVVTSLVIAHSARRKARDRDRPARGLGRRGANEAGIS